MKLPFLRSISHVTIIAWSGANPGGRIRLPEREQLEEKKMIKLGKKTTATLLTILFLSSVIGIASAYSPEANDWPKFHGNLWNTGVAYPELKGISTPEELWIYTTDNAISSSSPSLADIDNDDELETILGTANFAGTGGIYAIEADGSLKWKYQTGDYGTYACPALADVDDDGFLEIAFVSYAGKITVLEHDGTEKWVLDKGSAGTKVAIADVDGDGDLEVIAGAAGKIWLLNADGSEVWNKAFSIGTEPAIADVDGDGGLEIVFAALGTKTIVALNADGTTQWTSPAAGQDFQISLSIMNDVSGDGKLDVAVGCRDKNVYAYSGADGAEIWSYETVGRVFGIAVVDINEDGFDDIVATATKGDGVESYVYLLDGKTGALVWSHNILGKKYYSTEGTPSIVDVDKDGVLDVVTGSNSQKVYALSGTDGSEIWTFDINDDDPSCPAIADINNDGFMDIVIATGSTIYAITESDRPVPPTEVEIDIKPETLNLKSNGQYITSFITPPEGYGVGNIDPATVQLEGMPAEWSEIQDGIFMAKFDRSALIEYLSTAYLGEGYGNKFYEVTLTVTGKLLGGTPFAGTDTIKVIRK